jgi:hypothetical protein
VAAVGASDLLAHTTHEKHLLEALFAYYHAIDGFAGLLGAALLAEEMRMGGCD